MGNKSIIAALFLLVLLFLESFFSGLFPFGKSIFPSLVILYELIVPILLIEKNNQPLEKYFIHAHNLEQILDNFLSPNKKNLPVNYSKVWSDSLFTAMVSLITVVPYIILFCLYAHYLDNASFSFNYPKFFPSEILIQIFVVALPEELFYRGFLQNSLKQKFNHEKTFFGFLSKSIILTNIFFALSHVMGGFSIFRILTFFPGLIFSFLAIRTKSIFAPILFHALCNIVGQILFFGFYH